MTIELNVGIIGHGFIGKIHLENILKFPHVNVKAIYSKEEESLPSGISFYGDYLDLIKQENLDTIFICTPTFTHGSIACECIESGFKNIFLEKPMAPSMEDCNKILDMSREYNVNLMVGHVLRFWPTYGSVASYLKSSNSELGVIQSIIGKRLQTFPWSPWFADQEKSGGVILDLSIHDIDYATWLLGDVLSVSCKAKKINRFGMDVYGESTINLSFKNEKQATCEASWAKPAEFQFYTNTKIQGSKKTLELDGIKIQDNDTWKIENIFNSKDGYYNQVEHFFRVIMKEENKLGVTGIEGKNAVKTCLAAIKSAKKGGKEVFLKDME